jgi:hypothetical protein
MMLRASSPVVTTNPVRPFSIHSDARGRCENDDRAARRHRGENPFVRTSASPGAPAMQHRRPASSAERRLAPGVEYGPPIGVDRRGMRAPGNGVRVRRRDGPSWIQRAIEARDRRDDRARRRAGPGLPMVSGLRRSTSSERSNAALDRATDTRQAPRRAMPGRDPASGARRPRRTCRCPPRDTGRLRAGSARAEAAPGRRCPCV